MKTFFPQLDTPSLLIEKSILERNISEMQSLMNKHGVRLRPHIKTHKMPYLAKMQIEAGAVGIACAKVSEAHVFADAGIDDIQIANIIVGGKKYESLVKLQQKVRKLSCCVDSVDNAMPLSEYFSSQNSNIDVLIIVDCGYGRCGMSDYERILDLAQYINTSNSLNLFGITTHAGQAYGASSAEERIGIAQHEGEFMVDMANRLRADGIEIRDVTVGSNPTARHSCRVPGVTEIRSGNYIFNDMIQVALGTVGMKDCALSVLSQVISIPAPGRVILDAGSKALSSDRGAHGNENLKGYGCIVGKYAVLERLSEEHGIVGHSGESFFVGERVRIVPNHACTATNLHSRAFVVDGGAVLDEVEISARGMLW